MVGTGKEEAVVASESMPAARAEVVAALAASRGAERVVGRVVTIEPEVLAARRQFEGEALVHLDALYSFAFKLARARDDA